MLRTKRLAVRFIYANVSNLQCLGGDAVSLYACVCHEYMCALVPTTDEFPHFVECLPMSAFSFFRFLLELLLNEWCP